MPVDTLTYHSFRHTQRRHQPGPKCRGSVRKGRRRCQLLDVLRPSPLSAEETAWEAPKEALSPPPRLKKFDPAQVLHPMSRSARSKTTKSTTAGTEDPHALSSRSRTGKSFFTRLRTGASRRDNCFECVQENLARELRRRRPGRPRAHFVRALSSRTFKLNNPTPRPTRPNHPFLQTPPSLHPYAIFHILHPNSHLCLLRMTCFPNLS